MITQTFVFLSFIFSANIFASPMAITTQLPPILTLNPENPNHKKIIKMLPTLAVYQDSDDHDQYYYRPPFRVFNHVQGSATFITNTELIKFYDNAIALMTELKNPISVEAPDYLLEKKNGLRIGFEQDVKFIREEI